MRFLTRLLVFAVVTALMLAGGVVPYRPGLGGGGEPRRLFVGALEAFWWLGAAWLAVGFLRAFVVLERQRANRNLFRTYWPLSSTSRPFSQSSPKFSICP